MRILMRSGKSPDERYSPASALAINYIGNNLGNLVFTNASHWLMNTANQETISSHLRIEPNDADWINENYDAYVIPLANAFRQSFKDKLQAITDLIKKLDIPVMVLGVGAQVPLGNDFSHLKSMDQDVKNFVKAVLEKSARIGVRGEATKEYLTLLGFSEVDVIGCPSMFIHGEYVPLNQSGTYSQITSESRIALNFSPYVRKCESLVERSYKSYPRLDYFVQDIETMQTVVSKTPLESTGKFSGIPNYFQHPLFLQGRVRFHVDPISWMNDLRNYEFSFGTRIHGTIAAITSGVPATLIAHDSRTTELAEYFGIPYLKATELMPETSVSDLFEMWDSSKLLNGHAARFAAIKNFIEANGFEVATNDVLKSNVSASVNMKELTATPTISNTRDAKRESHLNLRNRIEILKYISKTPKPNLWERYISPFLKF